MTKCSKCGTRLEPNEKFCGNCGAKVEEEKAEKVTKKEIIEKVVEKHKDNKTAKKSASGKSFSLSIGKIIIIGVIILIAFACAIYKDDISYKINEMKEEKQAQKNIEAANIEGKWLEGDYNIGEDIDEGRYYVIGLDDYSHVYIFDSEEKKKKYDNEWDDKYLDLEKFLNKGEEASVKLEVGKIVRIDGKVGYEKSK